MNCRDITKKDLMDWREKQKRNLIDCRFNKKDWIDWRDNTEETL